jgi:hypothetical protein
LLSDAEVALYDVQNPWDLDGHPENAYVSALVGEAGTVLDVVAPAACCTPPAARGTPGAWSG